MKSNVLTLILLSLFLFSGCDKKEDMAPVPEVQANTFEGKIFDQPIAYSSGENNFQSVSGLWMGGGNSFAELGLETPGQSANDIQLLINSKIVTSPLTPARFKELFAVGAKSAEGNFAGFHIIFRKNGQTYTTVGGEQPAHFLEVTKLEELSSHSTNAEFNFRLEFMINCNLYTYGAPHDFAGKIENGKLVAYYQR